MIKETKALTADQLRPNQEFKSYKLGKAVSIPWRHYIKEIKDDCVIIYDKNRPYAGEQSVSRSAIFEVYIAPEEFNLKYKEPAKEIFEILSGREYVGEVGQHEFDNSWLGSTCQELYNNLKNQNFKLIGWFWLQSVKHGFFNDCNIGIIVENETGDRFWCHYTKQGIDVMCELYEEEIKGL